MKQTEENGGLRRISNEQVEQIINNQPANASYGCGCGYGSGSGDDWRVVGCGNGTSIDMGSGSGMPGVDRDNPNPYNIHLGESVTNNAMLTAQLNELLACSSDMRSILSPYISGQANLTINVGNMTEDPRSVMETEVDSNGNAVITINSMCITENGFDAYTYGVDNAGYQNDGTAACMFSTAMAHEALHAKHYYLYFESKNNTNSPSEAVQYLKDRGYSDEFVNIFYSNNGDSWSSIMDTQGTSIVSDNEHNYFKEHNLGVLDLVRNDFDNRIICHNEMNTMIINVKHLIFFVTITVVCLVFAASCGNTKPSGGDKKDDTLAIKPIIDTVELITSLEELYSYAPKNTVIETCDLSHLGLKEIPMLRQYNIKSLDLSNNEMRMFEGYRLFLPPSVENLYLDSCYIGDIRREDYCAKEDFTTSSRLIDYSVRLCFDEEEFPNLKMIDVSYNKINRIEVPEYTKILNTHYNDFKSIKNKVRETSNGMTNIKRDTVRMVTSVEDLYGLAPNTIIEVCDLSNQGLKKLPVLRPYNILKLDVSENNFDELNREERQYSSWKAMLPQSIRELKMNNSYNGALVRNTEYGKRSGGAYLLLRKNELPYLKTINISNNFIGGLYISAPAVHVNVSRNDLRKIEIKTNTINYLDVSYNWNMDKGIRVSPESIDTLKTDSCAHGMKLGKTNGLIEL